MFLSSCLTHRDQQSPISPQLREAEPYGPPAQPQDPGQHHLRLPVQLGTDRSRPVHKPAQPPAPPESCDPATSPSATDLHPREQVRCMAWLFLKWWLIIKAASSSCCCQIVVSDLEPSQFSDLSLGQNTAPVRIQV